MVSIIIPVYNTGDILNKCLGSVLSQIFEDWECIMVDDCSTDKNTIAILKKWTKKDQRFRLIVNEENYGIEKNRFVGLAAVQGEFVMFMDHDDWLYDKYSLQKLVDNACSTNSDIVIGHHNMCYGMINRPVTMPVPHGVIHQPELKNKYYCSYFGVNIMPVFVWARLYRKDLIDRARMEPHGLRYADDVAWNLFIMPYVKSVSIIPDTVYVHRWGGLSSTSSQALDEYKLFYEIRKDAIKRFDFPQAKKWLDIELKNVLSEYLRQLMDMQRMEKDKVAMFLNEEIKNPIWDEIKTNVKEYCHDAFANAFIEHDVDSMIQIVYSRVQSPRAKYKRLMKRLIRYFQ